jgi:hypothetical protein
MAVDTQAIALTPGIKVTGEFLSIGQGREWTDRDGKLHQPVMVTVLVGDRTIRLEYPSSKDATFWVGGVGRGDVVTLPCYPQSPKGATQVFFRGLRAID